MTTNCIRLQPTASEKKDIRALLNEIMVDPHLCRQDEFLEHAHVIAQELPRRIRQAFYGFKRKEDEPILLVTDNPVLLDGAEPTPEGHPELSADYVLNDAQLLHGLYGSLLGEPVGFTSQRNGSVYNNIIPLTTHSSVANSSAGSAIEFGFHVEDAFHPARADFIGLVCLRNDERATTTVSCVDGVALSAEESAILFQPRFRIGHNPIHSTTNVVSEDAQSIFFGHPDRPYVRINAANLRIDDYQFLERQALEKLLAHFARNRLGVILQSRDCIFIDNFRCVHARDAYTPLFGPRARWLSRVVFANDLRKSGPMRASVLERAIAA
ncbi:enduracididine beta-hydroxylase [mine drainage metagenome]|uniref:Enduracididine beta-hydroxylase n=1 Tax=mine drainage metagenome TaxID=410659 RepID=A0A1J5S3R0_9ZZZZ